MRIFANPNYNFIKWRWHALIASVIIIWAGVATMFVHHPQMGIEFTGGTQLVIQFDTPTDEQHVRAAVDKVSHDAVVQKYGRPDQNKISVKLPSVPGQAQGDQALDADAKRVYDALTAAHLTFVPKGGSKNVIGAVVGE